MRSGLASVMPGCSGAPDLSKGRDALSPPSLSGLGGVWLMSFCRSGARQFNPPNALLPPPLNETATSTEGLPMVWDCGVGMIKSYWNASGIIALLDAWFCVWDDYYSRLPYAEFT